MPKFILHETVQYEVEAKDAEEALRNFRNPKSGPFSHVNASPQFVVEWKVFDEKGIDQCVDQNVGGMY